MSHVNYIEQGICAKCGSGNTEVTSIQWDVSVVMWRECHDCGCVFLEAYDYATKGVPCEEGDE